MKIQLSDHFTYGKLLRFTLPSIVMMVFTSIYSVVDGYFVSNFAGQTALAAINLVYPFIGLLSAVGFMLGTGGSALIAKTLGEGDNERANRLFSLFVYVTAGSGCIMAGIGYFAMPGVIRLLGGAGDLYAQSLRYGNILLTSMPAFALQLAFQNMFVTAGKPQTGLYFTIGAGVTNMILDVLFVGVLRGGLAGAAWATVISECVGGLVPLLYFFRRNSSTLRLGRTSWDGQALLRGSTNGISELLSNISMSIVGMLYNMQLLRVAGESGVAAFGVLMYVDFVFLAAFIGFSVGIGPVVGYAYGAQNHTELKNLLKKGLIVVGVMATAMAIVAELAGDAISRFFVGYDTHLLDITRRGFEIFSISFLFAGFPIFTSAFFTGLNNGLISAVISVSRTLIFEVACILILPELLGVDGVWLSVVVAEIMATFVAVLLLRKYRKRYDYA